MADLVNKLLSMSLERLGSAALTDAEGKYIYVTKKWLTIMHEEERNVLGRYMWDIYPNTRARQVLREKTVLENQVISKVVDGRESRVVVNYYPLVEEGELLGIFLFTSFAGWDTAVKFSEEIRRLSRELSEARAQLTNVGASAAKYYINNIVGASQAVKDLKMDIAVVARTASNVLIEGETGVGKELVAHSIHSFSKRCEKPFVRVNCSAIPENLMESEFFGYEGGAFSGAKKSGMAGKFERASGGSLFLDEVHQLPLHMQPKFLRVIQENEVERIGGGRTIPIDTRIIAATNIPLEDYVGEGRFREDLFYRLNVVKIRVPPLRSHKEDIPLLVNDMVNRLNVRLDLDIQNVHPGVYDRLSAYDWPGNVRQLQNEVERAMNYAYEGTLRPEHFKALEGAPPAVRPAPLPAVGQGRREPPAYRQRELEELSRAIEACGGNKRKAARLLGVSRSTLYERLKKCGAPL